MGVQESRAEAHTDTVEEEVRKQIQNTPVLMYSTTVCGWCRRAKGEFEKMKVHPTEVKLDEIPEGGKVAHVLYLMTKQRTVPNIFIGGKHIGGFDSLMARVKNGALEKSFKDANVTYDPAYFTI